MFMGDIPSFLWAVVFHATGVALIISLVIRLWHHFVADVLSSRSAGDNKYSQHIHDTVDNYGILRGVFQSADSLDTVSQDATALRKRRRYLRRMKMVNGWLLVKHYLRWTVMLVLPKFLVGYPSVWDNVKVIAKNPKFRPLRWAIMFWLALFIFLTFFAAKWFAGAPASNAASITITCSGASDGPTAVTESSYTVADDLTFSGTGFCELDEALDVNSVTVSRGATITHPTSSVTGVDISTLGNFVLEEGAFINVYAKGCGGGGYTSSTNSGTSGQHGFGQASGSPSGACGVGLAGYGSGQSSSGGDGGSYGGAGGGSGGGAQQDEVTATLLGSGGGRDNLYGNGGNGGGKVKIDATGTATINGGIIASGEPGRAASGFTGGGGSGGGVYIIGSTIAGTGTVSSTGGNGYNWTHDSDGGSGGRVVMEYSSAFTFSNIDSGVTTAGGTNGGGGGAAGTFGTVIAKHTVNNLYNYYCQGTTSTPQAVTESLFSTSDDITFYSGNCAIDSSMRISDLVVASGGTLTHTTSSVSGLQIETTGDFTINAGGYVFLTGKGCLGADGGGSNHGYGPNTSGDNSCTENKAGAATFSGNGASGAGHASTGGLGSSTAANTVGKAYGSTTTPALLGSGGGQGSNPAYGGAGGGYVTLSVTGTLDIDGQLLVEGLSGVAASAWAGGGGSGGSLHVIADTVSGDGTISVAGGNGADNSNDGGGGSGGRISITYCTDSFGSITTSTAGGTGPGAALDGGEGSWYFVTGDNCNSAPSATDPSFTTSTDGTGDVTITTTLTDGDADTVSLKVEYLSGNCSSYSGQSTTTLAASVSASSGSPSVDNNDSNGRQISSISTGAFGNTVTTTWNSGTDQSSADGQYCIFLTPYDGTDTGSTASTTVTIDNVNPTASGGLLINSTSTSAMILTLPSTTSTDTNFNEYKIFYKEGSGGVLETDTEVSSTTDSNLASSTFGGASTTTISGLSANLQYVFNLFAYDTFGNTSSAATEVSGYTLANAPGAPTVGSPTQNTLALTIDANSNSTTTEFAIYNATIDKYISATGNALTSPVYQTTSTWGSSVTVRGLSTNTGYQFEVLARNGDSILTASSSKNTLAYTDVAATTTLVSTANARVTEGNNTLILDGTPGGGTGAFETLNVENTVSDQSTIELDFGRIVQNDVLTTTNEITVTRNSDSQENNFKMIIPAGTEVTGPSNWDGQMKVPTVKSSSDVQVQQGSAELVIEVGSSDGEILFDTAVKLVLPNQAGKSVAYQRPGDPKATVITLACTGINDSSNIDGNGECKIDDNQDLVIWTKHFTNFFSFNNAGGVIHSQTPPSVLSRGGSGGGDDLDIVPLQAIDINNGAVTTTQRDVTIVTNVFGATMVALSHTPVFADSVFVPFARLLDWTLSEENGEKTVYARFRTQEGGTLDTSDTIILAVSDNEEDDIPVEIDEAQLAPLGCSLATGRPYATTDEPRAVYLITDDCTKKLFPNESLFYSYFGSFTDVIEVTTSSLAKVPTDTVTVIPLGPRYVVEEGNLLKTIVAPDVYFVSELTRYLIRSESVFEAFGFGWDSVKDVVSSVLDRLIDGGDIEVIDRR